MEASMSYQAGKPIISDREYDELKGTLRKKNSKVVQQVGLVSTLRQKHFWMEISKSFRLLSQVKQCTVQGSLLRQNQQLLFNGVPQIAWLIRKGYLLRVYYYYYHMILFCRDLDAAYGPGICTVTPTQTTSRWLCSTYRQLSWWVFIMFSELGQA